MIDEKEFSKEAAYSCSQIRIEYFAVSIQFVEENIEQVMMENVDDNDNGNNHDDYDYDTHEDNDDDDDDDDGVDPLNHLDESNEMRHEISINGKIMYYGT